MRGGSASGMGGTSRLTPTGGPCFQPMGSSLSTGRLADTCGMSPMGRSGFTVSKNSMRCWHSAGCRANPTRGRKHDPDPRLAEGGGGVWDATGAADGATEDADGMWSLLRHRHQRRDLLQQAHDLYTTTPSRGWRLVVVAPAS